jgi:hypothetical protein
MDDPAWACLAVSQVLRQTGHPDWQKAQQTGAQLILSWADSLPDPEHRRQLLENVPTHRALLI